MEIGWSNDFNRSAVCGREVVFEAAFVKARRHLAIETGGRRALAQAFALARVLDRLNGAAARAGLTMELHTTNQGTAPEPWDCYHGLQLEARFIRDNRIVADVALRSDGDWSRTGQLALIHSPYHTADATLRDILRDAAKARAERQAQADAKAAAWLADQPAEVQALYRESGARPTCLRAGTGAVCEALHDVGGSMTTLGGQSPEELRNIQARHDAVYHAHG